MTFFERLESRPGLVALALFGALLGVQLPRAGSPALWGDEAVNLFWAGLPLGELISVSLNSDNPPLFFVLLKLWISVFGIDEFAVRALPAIFAAMTGALSYLAARKLVSPRALLISIPLLVVSPVLHEYAHELRPVTLAAALAAGSIWLLVELHRWRAVVAIAAFTVIEIALLTTHYLTVLFFPIQLAIALLVGERAILRRAAAAQALCAVVAASLFWIVVVKHAVRPAPWLKRPGVSELRNALLELTGSVWALGALSLLLAIVLFRVWQRRRPDRARGLLALACWALGPPLLDALWSQF